MSVAPPSSRLRGMARAAAAEQAEAAEHCELCGVPIAPEHRHVLELRTRELRCACRACSLLFDRGAAGGGHLRLVPDRRMRLDGFVLGDELWDALRIPVEMAFFFESSAEGRAQAYYPSPAGPTESLLTLDAWADLRAANPVLATLEPDVEALLVDRARGARRHFLVGIDECYRLVGLIRTWWRGFTGGAEVWSRLADYFEDLDARSRVHTIEKELR